MLVGQSVSHFKVIDHIGSGGMGQVYLARDMRLGRKVALKVLIPEFTLDSDRVGRFEREARAASALNHPNIVTIYDIGQSDAGRFIVMELVVGETLQSLAAEPQDFGLIADLGGQIAEALEVAHEAGLVHRDIKPQNIMRRDDGYVKVVDFGLVRLMPTDRVLPNDETRPFDALSSGQSADDSGETSSPGMLIGTASYMSPEQALGRAVTSAGDMFSLGIILYQMTIGRHPFSANTPMGFLNSIVSQDPLSLSESRAGIPGQIEALIAQLLDKDPDRRPTATEVRNAFALFGETYNRDPSSLIVAKHHQTVGRDQEHDQLRVALDQALAGKSSVICVTGEPGIGKTTLVEDFLSSITSDPLPIQVARGRCSERLAGTEAYLPIFDALENLVRSDTRSPAFKALKRLAPTWYVQLEPVSSATDSEDQALADVKLISQGRMKREIAMFLEEISRQQRVVLCLDDFHWADTTSVELLAHLASRFDSMHLLVVVTYRPTDLMLAQHPFMQVKLDLESRGLCREVSLEFLSRQGVEEYLSAEFPNNLFPADLVDLLYTRTEGSPLFMVDLVRYLRDQEVLVERGGRWILEHAVSEIGREIPQSVRSMITRLLDRLEKKDRQLLAAASIQGQEFDAVVVAKTLNRAEVDVEEQLESLDRVHGLVRSVSEHEFPDSTLTVKYRFVHALYQNALYSALSPGRRKSWSQDVAQSLMGLYGNQSGEYAAELGLLFEVARDFQQAADFFLQAARNAAAVSANAEAASMSKRAIACAERLEEDARCDRILQAAFDLAQFHLNMSQFHEAVAVFELATKTATEIGNVEAEIDGLCGSSLALETLRKSQEAEERGQRALKLATENDLTDKVTSAQVLKGMSRMSQGDLAGAEKYFVRAEEILKEEDPSPLIVHGIGWASLLRAFQLEYKSAYRLGEWSRREAKKLGDSFTVIQSQFIRGMALGNHGRISEAMDVLHEGLRLGELNDERYWISRIPNTIGWLHRELEDMETALRMDHENVQLAREMGFPEGEANSHVNLGYDYLSLGEPDRAFEHLNEAQRIFDTDEWFRWRYNIRLQAELARYWISRGDLRQAASHATSCGASAQKYLSRKYLAWSHKLLGDIATLEQRVEDAGREFTIALDTLRDHPCPTIEWKILGAAGGLAGLTKDTNSRDLLFGRAEGVVHQIADAAGNSKLSEMFLSSKPIRDLKA